MGWTNRTLDALAHEYRPGNMIRVGNRWMTVLGVAWSLPLEPGAPRTPAIVAQDKIGVGHVFEPEIEERADG